MRDSCSIDSSSTAQNCRMTALWGRTCPVVWFCLKGIMITSQQTAAYLSVLLLGGSGEGRKDWVQTAECCT